jgi:hypothetical protein
MVDKAKPGGVASGLKPMLRGVLRGYLSAL